MKSIKIDDATHKELKVFCAKNEMPLTFVVNQGVALYIAEHKRIEKYGSIKSSTNNTKK